MTTTYDPGLVTVIVGPHTLVGFQSGSFVRVSRTNDTWKHEKGAQGDGVRTRNRDRSGTLVVTLQSTSPSNADLTNIARKDDEDPNPETYPVLVKYGAPEDDGRVLWSGQDGWVLKPADSEFSDEHTPREWTVVIDDLKLGQ